MNIKEYFGEFLGTFILVLFGCGSVAVSVLLEGFTSLLEVALIWGFGVTLAIFTVRNICPAHLNPSVSIAMVLSKDLPLKKLPLYVLCQFLGAFAAAWFLYFAFEDALLIYEQTNGIIRGSIESKHSAMMFGEFFPNPAFENKIEVSHLLACVMEIFGTFFLVLIIYKLTEKKEQIDNLVPVLIGLTITILICLIAPLTQAGFNPARDFGPRMVAYLSGWGQAAFPTINYSFLTVYIISPIIGAVLGFYCDKYSKREKI